MHRSAIALTVMLAATSCGTPAPEKCDAVTCSSGCCDALGECRQGFESTACGSPGGVCTPCGPSQLCSFGICLGGGASGGGTGGGSGGGTTGGGSGGGTTGGGAGGGGTTGGGAGGGGVVTGGGSGGGGGMTGGGTGGGTNDGGVSSCSNITGDRRTQVCPRWTCDRADMSEGTWNGSVATCTAGDLTPAARANSLKLINTYRFIADLPAVITAASRDTAAQECALMMDAPQRAQPHAPLRR